MLTTFQGPVDIVTRMSMQGALLDALYSVTIGMSAEGNLRRRVGTILTLAGKRCQLVSFSPSTSSSPSGPYLSEWRTSWDFIDEISPDDFIRALGNGIGFGTNGIQIVDASSTGLIDRAFGGSGIMSIGILALIGLGIAWLFFGRSS